MPSPGDVFADVRDDGRTMRVSYHPEVGVVVVSLWAGRVCRASFQLAAGEVARLAEVLGDIAASIDREVSALLEAPKPGNAQVG
jgi:hypothetical protein